MGAQYIFYEEESLFKPTLKHLTQLSPSILNTNAPCTQSPRYGTKTSGMFVFRVFGGELTVSLTVTRGKETYAALPRTPSRWDV